MSGATPLNDAALAEAADWFSLYRSGDTDAGATRRRAEWLAADPANAAAYAAIERAWAIAGDVSDEPAILSLREEGTRALRREAWRMPLRLAASVAIVASLTLAGVVWREVMPGTAAPSTYHNAVGDRTRLRLADGTTVTLDTDSEIRVRSMAPTRSVELVHGRAFFDVAHDPSRPFLVSAGNKVVRAVGTAFSVRFDTEKDDVKVALVEGKVEVKEPGDLLRAGRSVELTAGAALDADDAGRWQVGRFDRLDETGWIGGRLVFSNRAIGDAVAEMNRYSTRKLVLVPGRGDERTVMGVFRAGDVDALAQAIVLSGSMEVVRSNDQEVVLEDLRSIRDK